MLAAAVLIAFPGATPANAAAADVGPFLLHNKNTVDLCLVTRADPGEPPAVLTDCADWTGQWPDQWWHLTQVGANYRIANRYINRCLVARGGGDALVVGTVCGNYRDQFWAWHSGSDGDQQFVNQNNGRCLTVRGGAGSQAVTADCDFNHGTRWADQRWRMIV